MTWKTAHRSFYYQPAPEPADPVLLPGKVALLVIDVQNTYLETANPNADPAEAARWAPFNARMRETVIPSIARLMDAFRDRGLDVLFARIACQLETGRDRSQKAGSDIVIVRDPIHEYRVGTSNHGPAPTI